MRKWITYLLLLIAAPFMLLFVMTVAIGVLWPVASGVYHFPDWVAQQRFLWEVRRVAKSGVEEIPLRELTSFEWEEVCRGEGYQDSPTHPYVWELTFYGPGDQKIVFEFDEEERGLGYETNNSEMPLCISHDKATLKINYPYFLLTEKYVR